MTRPATAVASDVQSLCWRRRLFFAIWRQSANPVEYLRLLDRRAITVGWEVAL